MRHVAAMSGMGRRQRPARGRIKSAQGRRNCTAMAASPVRLRWEEVPER
jgi:hypothetical protein